mmetsp:Transcript_32017/g.75057  ORF Transcript_32017/g.75057 Transcript_32017/m.75057 type:complete len:282 (+) Transcript_32017:50-895(+)
MDWPLSREEKVARLLNLYDLDVGRAAEQLHSRDAALDALMEVIQQSGALKQSARRCSRASGSVSPSRALDIEAEVYPSPPASARQSRFPKARISDASTSAGSQDMAQDLRKRLSVDSCDAPLDNAMADRLQQAVQQAAADVLQKLMESQEVWTCRAATLRSCSEPAAKFKQHTRRAVSRRRRRKSHRTSVSRARRPGRSVGPEEGMDSYYTAKDAAPTHAGKARSTSEVEEGHCEGTSRYVRGRSSSPKAQRGENSPQLVSLESFLDMGSAPDFPFPQRSS